MKKLRNDILDPLTGRILIVANAKPFYNPSKAKHKYLIKEKYFRIYWRGSWCLLEIEIGTPMEHICFQFLSQLKILQCRRFTCPF